MAPVGSRLTRVVGRLAVGPNHIQPSLVAFHMFSYPFSTCLSFWYVGLVLHVGSLIHVSLISML